MMAAGDRANHRLNRFDDRHRVPVDGLDLYVFRDFLDPEDCQTLTRLIDERCHPAMLHGGRRPDHRSSHGTRLPGTHPIVIALEARLDALIGLPSSSGEPLDGQRYTAGQHFRPHFDAYGRDARHWDAEERRGGQRTWTMLLYLNSVDKGGQTHFPNVAVKARPRAGTMLVWYNLDDRGEINPRSLHEGCPVEAGVKYITTRWYRQGNFVDL